jgi:hypothetical protein
MNQPPSNSHRNEWLAERDFTDVSPEGWQVEPCIPHQALRLSSFSLTLVHPTLCLRKWDFIPDSEAWKILLHSEVLILIEPDAARDLHSKLVIKKGQQNFWPAHHYLERQRIVNLKAERSGQHSQSSQLENSWLRSSRVEYAIEERLFKSYSMSPSSISSSSTCLPQTQLSWNWPFAQTSHGNGVNYHKPKVGNDSSTLKKNLMSWWGQTILHSWDILISWGWRILELFKSLDLETQPETFR